MSIFFNAPPALKSTDSAENLFSIRSYLMQLSDQLNIALGQLESTQEAQIAQAVAQATGAAQNGEQTTPSDEYTALKSLIIRTADIVHSEIDQVETRLESEYIAKSDWGTYEESIQADIKATAEGIVQSYNYDARLESLEEDAVSFEQYRISTSGYIRQGIIGYNDGVPVIGIAIGQDIATTGVKETVNGVEYDVFADGQNLATYTASKMSFYQNGVEVAYVSNAAMVITNANVTNKLTLGGWEISKTNGLTIRWIGG